MGHEIQNDGPDADDIDGAGSRFAACEFCSCSAGHGSSVFPDGGNVEPFRQPAAVTVNNAITIDSANAATAPQAISKASTQVGSVAMWTTANVWGISLLVISMTLVTLYSLARAKKQSAERRSA